MILCWSKPSPIFRSHVTAAIAASDLTSRPPLHLPCHHSINGGCNETDRSEKRGEEVPFCENLCADHSLTCFSKTGTASHWQEQHSFSTLHRKKSCHCHCQCVAEEAWRRSWRMRAGGRQAITGSESMIPHHLIQNSVVQQRIM